MSLDVVDLRSFYNTPLGLVARHLILRSLNPFWSNLKGLRVLGLGFATPYLDMCHGQAERTLAFMPAQQGVVNWPSHGLTSSTLIDPLSMPLPDASIDRVLVAHALEMSDNAIELFHEIWRILTPGGRVLVIVPNRQGLWARTDLTPFGHGRPYSRSQLNRLMRETMFSPEVWAETLYMPPVSNPALLRTAGLWEKCGNRLFFPFAGVHIVDATKQLYRPIIARPKRAFQMRLPPVFAPAPAST